jgi:hypothetical protein
LTVRLRPLTIAEEVAVSKTKNRTKKGPLQVPQDEGPSITTAVLGLLAFGLLLGFVPILVTQKAWIPALNFTKFGPIGDTIGGTTAPFIGFAAVFTTFIAFLLQYRANISQSQQFGAQSEYDRRDKFDQQLQNLILIHRENASQLTQNDRPGEKPLAFTLFEEFRAAYFVVSDLCGSQRLPQFNITASKISDMAFTYFLYGVQGDLNLAAAEIIESNESLEPFGKACQLALFEISKDYKPGSDLNIRQYTVEQNEFVRFPYKPFAGHLQLLGQYFRHLYLTIRFIDDFDSELLSDTDKYLRAKIVRASMSSHEQLLLYYNAFSRMGRAWRKPDLLRKYKLTRNIPLQLCDFGVHPHEAFGVTDPAKERLFEWDEIIDPEWPGPARESGA